MKRLIPIYLCVLILLAACARQQEDIYLYEVNEVEVTQSGVDKNNPKAELEFISLVYSDLYGGTVSQAEIDAIIIAYNSLGDKQLITDIIIRNMLNSPEANLPSNADMRADLDQFIEDVYVKFYIREPNAYEKWQLKSMIEADPDMSPEMIYYAFLTLTNIVTSKFPKSMKRRSFLKHTAAVTAGTVAAPYILPSGRLFAKTLNRKLNHVVFCLFAGGVRNIEAVHQDLGNLMPSMLNGTPSTEAGLASLPASPYSKVLQSEGVLFPEFRYKDGPTGHYNGHTVALTGVYTDTGLNLRANPEYPTIFEYYLKHNSPAVTAKNAWWVSNALGPYPALNYSSYPGYGPAYGANHISPTYLLNPGLAQLLGMPKQFQFHEEEKVAMVRDFLNKNFGKDALADNIGIVNTPEEARTIKDFIQSMYTMGQSGGLNDPLGIPSQQANNDIYNILFAEEIIKEFQPELLVVNMTDIDACHQNFTRYMVNLQKADYAVAHLWNTIQSTPGMANDTLLVMVPEHGRNLETNTVRDSYNRLGVDHTGDPTSREIFAMFIGPSGVIQQNAVIGTPGNPVGETIDLIPTVANILGFDADIPAGLLNGRVLNEIFV